MEMQAAILKGIYNIPNQPSFSCPSGNCTWTDLNTLAICGGCEEITDQIETQCSLNSTVDPRYTVEYRCDYRMPSHKTLTGFGDLFTDKEITRSDIYTTWNSSAQDLGISSSTPYDFSRKPARMTGIDAIQVSENYTVGEGIYTQSFTGSRCTFALCIKTYPQIKVTDGVLDISTPKEDYLRHDHISNRSYDTTFAGETVTSVGLFYELVSSSALNDDDTQPRYTISQKDYWAIQAYIKGMFTIALSKMIGSQRPKAKWNGAAIDTPDIGVVLAKVQVLDETIRILAESMTEAIRTGPNSTINVGLSYVEKTFIVIRWGYLAYPIALVLLTLVVLVAVILETKRQKAIAWKSSTLALLFHNLDGWDISNQSIRNVQELEKVAQRMTAQLADYGDISAFVKAD